LRQDAPGRKFSTVSFPVVLTPRALIASVPSFENSAEKADFGAELCLLFLFVRAVFNNVLVQKKERDCHFRVSVQNRTDKPFKGLSSPPEFSSWQV
jgi:hypothetical protein